MGADAVLIIDLRGGAELRLGVILVPVFQPVPEGHLGAQPFGLQSAAAIPERLELFQTLRFCFREDVFDFWVAVVVVADDDAALLAPVLAQPYGSVSVLSFSCHGFSSFPKRSSMKPPTMPLALLCMSEVTWV